MWWYSRGKHWLIHFVAVLSSCVSFWPDYEAETTSVTLVDYHQPKIYHLIFWCFSVAFDGTFTSLTCRTCGQRWLSVFHSFFLVQVQKLITNIIAISAPHGLGAGEFCKILYVIPHLYEGVG